MYTRILVLFALFFLANAEDIFVLDCEGSLTLRPSTPLVATKVSFPTIRKAYDVVHARLYEKLKCPCPGVSEKDFYQYFAVSTLDFWMSILSGDESAATYGSGPACEDYMNTSRAIRNNITKTIRIKLPSGCTYNDWVAGNTCLIKVDPIPDYQLQLALKRCPNSRWPFISLSCGGMGCSNVGMPCNNDDECGSKKCVDVRNITGIPSMPSGPSSPFPGPGPFPGPVKREASSSSEDPVSSLLSLPLRLVSESLNSISVGSSVARINSLLQREEEAIKRNVFQGTASGSTDPTVVRPSIISAFLNPDPQMLFGILKGMKIYDENDTSPGCLSASTIFGQILKMLRKYAGGVETSYNMPSEGAIPLRVCGWNPPLLTSENLTALVGLAPIPDQGVLYASLPGFKPWDGMIGTERVDSSSRMSGVFPLFPAENPLSLPLDANTPPGTPKVTLFSQSCRAKTSLFPSSSANFINILSFFFASINGDFSLRAPSPPPPPPGTPLTSTGSGFNNYAPQSETETLPVSTVSSASISIVPLWSAIAGLGTSIPVSFQYPALYKMTEDFYTMVSSSQKCRAIARGTPITDDAVKIRMGYPLDFVLNQFTVSGSDKNEDLVNLGPKMSNWTIFSQIMPKLELPASCSYKRWKEEGVCSFSFTGLESLLQGEIQIRVQVSQCPGLYTGLSLTVDCVGKTCSFLNTVTSCSTNSDCSALGGRFKCQDLFSKVESNSDLLYVYFGQSATTPKGATCGGRASFMQDFKVILSGIFGYTFSNDNSMKVCVPDWKEIFNGTDFNLTKWTQDQFSIQAGGQNMKLNSLNQWIPTTTPGNPLPPPPISVTPKCSLSTCSECLASSDCSWCNGYGCVDKTSVDKCKRGYAQMFPGLDKCVFSSADSVVDQINSKITQITTALNSALDSADVNVTVALIKPTKNGIQVKVSVDLNIAGKPTTTQLTVVCTSLKTKFASLIYDDESYYRCDINLKTAKRSVEQSDVYTAELVRTSPSNQNGTPIAENPTGIPIWAIAVIAVGGLFVVIVIVLLIIKSRNESDNAYVNYT